ncbi:MAG: hypothetical protein KF709_12540 [Gemmatimonadaceae bacterium]|nr:hypothetical protein [Gemmatimonadaceae bacterium]
MLARSRNVCSTGLAQRSRLARFTRFVAAGLVSAVLAVAPLRAQHLLLPMDESQTNHLKAYGVTFSALTEGMRSEWLLNFRGGSFLLLDTPAIRRAALLAGVTFEALDGNALAAVRRQINDGNMDAVPLERAPRIAVYSPPQSMPWDDAVTLALTYAGIPYQTIWDDDVITTDLSQFDWIHLHHEDFTGQQHKLYLGFRDAPWYVQARERDLQTARKYQMRDIPELKKMVAERLRAFVERGGFLFAMCGATETLEMAVAGFGVDIAAAQTDGTPMDPAAESKLDWTRTFAIQGAHLEYGGGVNAMSDIDGHQVNVPSRRQPLGTFSLFGFSAKFDPVATMLVQNHRAVLRDYYGVTTSFTRKTLKPGVTILAHEEGAPWVKYIHGSYGRGSFTYLGGHDPEDPQHSIGAPPTDLALHPNSPGYRLILNNVLFPAAKKKPLKT